MQVLRVSITTIFIRTHSQSETDETNTQYGETDINVTPH